MNQRLDYLDQLRTALTMLVVVFHASIAYGAAGSWILVDVDTSELTVTSILLTLFTAVCQAFFMGLFFFLSSYFIPASYDRKGAGRFLKDRLIRLGVPFVGYTFIIGPLTYWFAHLRGMQSAADFYRTEVWSFKQIFVGPTWFLEALLLFSILYAVFRILVASKPAAPSERASFPTNTTLLVSAVSIGLIAFAVRFVYATGEGTLGLQFGYFPSYILLFIAGILANRNGWLAQLPARTVKRWGWTAVCAIPVLPIGFILTGALDGHLSFEGGLNVQAILYAFWEPFVCFGIILWLLRLFQSRFHTSSPLQKWLAAHAYAVYFIHPPVIVCWTMAMHQLGWPPAIKWVIVSMLSIATCLLAAAVLRAVPKASRVL
ncbi:acyltransferase [Paenibacillus silvisoli]|uniref:acyltransferase n=1 Tax=Paenibacillus silvisoli TaxID=3110539 RepID=UPI0028046C8D|nr:acyltransferase family protein [Paenibacillus silvisoli]